MKAARVDAPRTHLLETLPVRFAFVLVALKIGQQFRAGAWRFVAETGRLLKRRASKEVCTYVLLTFLHGGQSNTHAGEAGSTVARWRSTEREGRWPKRPA